MFKVLQQTSPALGRTCLPTSQLLLNGSPCTPIGWAASIQPVIFSGCLANAESRRFARNTKPWNIGPTEQLKKGVITYEFRRKRAKKVAKVEMPDFDVIRMEQSDQLITPDEMRLKLKEKGIVPHRSWDERPLYIGTSNTIIDPYNPPEGDGKMSIISKESAKKQMDKVTGKGRGFMALRKIRSYLPTFEPSEWVSEAQDTYVASHQALVDRDLDKLYSLATDKALPDILFNISRKTIRWQMLRSLEPARVVHVRTEEAGQGNVFAQLTVRFHTQQTLAVYDRFGRLLHGSEAIVKDVLDYIVFERALTDQYGHWRIHHKIVPKWNERQSFSRFTAVLPQTSVDKEQDEQTASTVI